MLPDARQLGSFYLSVPGRIVQAALWQQISAVTGEGPPPHGLAMLGVGYAQPYLTGFAAGAGHVIAFSPLAMGCAPSPGEAPVITGEESVLPFADGSFDRILVVHGLELAENARLFLRQLWRVLVPEGRLTLVVPNRTSLWTVAESSPFAAGRPYRRGELDGLLRDGLFEPLRWRRALYMLPGRGARLCPKLCENVGSRLMYGMGGVHVVETKKTIYGVTPLPRLQPNAAQLIHA